MIYFSFYVNDVNKERKVKYYTCILIDPFNKLILIEYHFNNGVIWVFIGIGITQKSHFSKTFYDVFVHNAFVLINSLIYLLSFALNELAISECEFS